MNRTTTKRRAPSVQSLVDAFRITEEEARAIRAKLQAGKMASVNDPGFYGVERAGVKVQ